MEMSRKFPLGVVIAVFLLALFGGSFLGAYFALGYPSWSQYLFKNAVKTSNSTSAPLFGEKRTVATEESSVIKVVDEASPAVVSVVTKNVNFDPDTGIVEEEQGIGTAFIIDSNGTILTNNHVVSDEKTEYTVVTKDKKSYPAAKISRDPSNDLAIIKINATGLPTVKIGDSSALKPGQYVVAIGNALGKFDNSVTTGVVSQLGRKVTASASPFGGARETLENVIQTDAALNPGNSGGPLLNLSGEVIGVNVATTQGAQNIGFAIPINIAKGVLDGYQKQGRIVRPYLGVSYQVIEGSTKYPSGGLVRLVVPGSPAEKAGIQQKDIITKIDDSPVSPDSPLSAAIAKHKVGDTITIVVWRDGKELKLQATLAESPDQSK